MKFETKILQFGNNTGILVPEEILESLGGGKKPLVVVHLNNYTYRNAVGKMGDQFLISLSAEHRKNAQVNGGDVLEVEVELDTKPRLIEIPSDLQIHFDQNKLLQTNFEKLAPSKQKAMVLSINDAKSEETRTRRITAAIDQLTTS